ncbi:DUF624 domain-containing protein [Brachybacterium timonense]|uniref:DUF624 domain-containing protein n=1 Tax=Brachybacterium timonense TaxID=2050896 RepID=UPI000D0B36B1|nr:DUF624 domain-containing protein [Brachybacterium timonense]
MTSAVEGAGPEEADAQGGALTGVMRALAWVPRLVGLHLGWIALVLAGGIVLGIGPAGVALVAELEERSDRPPQLQATAARVLGRFRRELVPASLAVGPFLVIGTAAALNLVLAGVGLAPGWFVPYGLGPAAVLLLWAIPAFHHAIVLRVLRPEVSIPDLWRAAAAAPVLLPVASIGWWVTIGSVLVVCAVIVPVGVLMGSGLVVAATWALLLRAWQGRIEEAAAARAAR